MNENKPFNYGGQAVIEGVMMRGSKNLSVAVRDPQGNIVTHTEPLNQTLYNGPMMRIPFVRGLTLLWDSLGLGMRSLMFSANIALIEEDADEPDVSFSGPLAWGSVIVSLAFGIGLFFLLPAFITGLVDKQISSSLLSNLVEGLIRLSLLVGYVWVISFIPDIRRVFAYHGAEHKTINAYEAGVELTPQSVSRFSTQHPRCGTAFLLTLVVLSILIFSLLGRPPLWLRLTSRLLFIPVLAGIAYEFIRFSARHQDKAWMRAIIAPNLALQRLTTREPNLQMLEVAITAFNHMMVGEPSSAKREPANAPAGEIAAS